VNFLKTLRGQLKIVQIQGAETPANFNSPTNKVLVEGKGEVSLVPRKDGSSQPPQSHKGWAGGQNPTAPAIWDGPETLQGGARSIAFSW
jgi:hypothetical protein